MPVRKDKDSVLKAMPRPVLLAFGANQNSDAGPPAATIAESIKTLVIAGVEICAVSRFFSTLAFPPGTGQNYVNAAVSCRTELPALGILAELHRIEGLFGRRRSRRWGERTLDIDLLAVSDQILPDRNTHEYWRGLDLDDQKRHIPDQLILPHPRIQDRAFVLVPLAEIAPNWTHPILGASVAEMLQALSSDSLTGIRPLKDQPIITR